MNSFYQLRPEISGLILYLMPVENDSHSQELVRMIIVPRSPVENDSHYQLLQFFTILNMRMILIISSTFVLPGAIENQLQ